MLLWVLTWVPPHLLLQSARTALPGAVIPFQETVLAVGAARGHLSQVIAPRTCLRDCCYVI